MFLKRALAGSLCIFVITSLIGMIVALLFTIIYGIWEMGFIGLFTWFVVLPFIMWSSLWLFTFMGPLLLISCFALQWCTQQLRWYLVTSILYSCSFMIFYGVHFDWLLGSILGLYHISTAVLFVFISFKIFVDPDDNEWKFMFDYVFPKKIHVKFNQS